VPRSREHDDRIAIGGALLDLARHGQRVEEKQTLAIVDCV
jgi:hypothetical protein